MPTDLLILTPGFAANEQDSTCIPPLQVYLRHLRARRPELRIAVIALHYPMTEQPYQWHGIDVFPCGGGNARWKKPLTWFRAQHAFDALMRRGPIGVVHSLWLGETAVLGMRFARQCGARHVLTVMGQDARDGRRWWDLLPTRPLVVCVSERQNAALHTMSGAGADAIIPWGIDAASRMEDAVRDNDLIFVGSMIDVKRPRGFLRLHQDLSAQRDVRALMIGRSGRHSPDRAVEHGAFSTGASQLDVSGELPRGQVLRHMARSRILVHTSSYESQGYVFDEALINGLSIVSYAVGSAVASDRWRVVNDHAAMVIAVAELLDHPPLPTSLVLRPVERTVDSYLDAYGLA